MSLRIAELAGRQENVIQSYFCMTRLRLILKDKSLADIEGLKAIDGVSGVKNQQGQIQVIIGSDVNKLHEEFIRICPDQEMEEAQKQQEEMQLQKENLFNRVTAFIAGIFIPLVPCLAGTGIISAILSCFTYFGWMSSESDLYTVLNLIQNAVFYFLPFLAGLGAAKQFKTNEFFALVMAGIIMSPTILAAIEQGVSSYSFLGIPMVLTDCSSTVIPIVF